MRAKYLYCCAFWLDRASGTVVRTVKIDSQQPVAIKMMKLESQPNKELMVTKIEVTSPLPRSRSHQPFSGD